MDTQEKNTETIKAPAGLNVQGIAAPKKDTRVTTEDVKGKKGLSFTDFGLSQDVQLGIYEKGYEMPSPI